MPSPVNGEKWIGQKMIISNNNGACPMHESMPIVT